MVTTTTNYKPYPPNNGNSYGNSYSNNRNTSSELETMLKDFITTQTTFNKTVEEKLGKIDILASKVDSLVIDVDLLKSKVMPNDTNESKTFAKINAIQIRIDENVRMMAQLRARWEREEELAKVDDIVRVCTITTTENNVIPHASKPPTINGNIIGVGNVSSTTSKHLKLPKTP